MANNHLEQLIAEWYEYQGYFIRRNVKVGKRKQGGFEGELDIVAFQPATKHLIHLEASLDADSWDVREKRYAKKFALGKTHIPSLFTGLAIPVDIEQVAVLVFASKQHRDTLGGGKIMLVPELLEQIFTHIKGQRLAKNMIDEQKPILRTMQFITEYWPTVHGTLEK